MSAGKDGSFSFALPNISGRGFAMGHQSGTVSMCFTMRGCSFSMDAVSNAEARAIAQTIVEAADFAAAEQARREANRAAVAEIAA